MADDPFPDPPSATGELAPRVEPAPTATLGWRARVAVSVIARVTGDEAPHVFTTLARHPRLFRRWLPFAGWLLLRTDLPRRDVEVLVLRTAWNTRSPYVWTQHVSLARKAGVSTATIGAIPNWEAAATVTPRQRALLRATDDLHERRVITDRTWSLLEEHLSEAERIEVCFVVGHYEMVAMTVNTLGVETDAPAAGRLDPAATRVSADARRRLGRLRTGG